MLARWRLRFSEFHFDIIHRAGIKYQASDALSKIQSGGEDYTDINDDIPDADIDPIDDVSEASKASSYTVCYICAYNEQEPSTMMLEVQYYDQQQDPK